MTCNMGKIDRIIRTVLGTITLIIAIVNTSIITGIISVLLLGTALAKWCPVCALLGINTGCNAKKD